MESLGMAEPDIKSNRGVDKQNLTAQLRDKIVQQVAESGQVQMDLRKWYAMKLGKEVQELNLNECPALLRVMQVIRLLRESQLEFEEDLAGFEDPL
jgi:hypothetical protein